MRTTIAILLLALAMTGCNLKKPIEQPPQGVQAQRMEAASRAGSSETAVFCGGDA